MLQAVIFDVDGTSRVTTARRRRDDRRKGNFRAPDGPRPSSVTIDGAEQGVYSSYTPFIGKFALPLDAGLFARGLVSSERGPAGGLFGT